MKTLTYITPTTGSEHLIKCIRSVREQTVKCNHLIVYDGFNPIGKVGELVREYVNEGRVHLVILPENTARVNGDMQWYGHRIYAAMPFIVNADYVAFLDEDNWVAENHAERMMEAIGDYNVVTCRRVITYPSGEIMGNDNFESIGETVHGILYDTSTYVFRTDSWRLYAGDSLQKYACDRMLSLAVHKSPHVHIPEHLLYYRSREQNIPFFYININDLQISKKGNDPK